MITYKSITDFGIKRKVKEVMFLMEEANRRKITFHNDKPLNNTWLGLGTEAVYRPAVQNGLMTRIISISGRGILGWYVLTDKGIELYKKLYT